MSYGRTMVEKAQPPDTITIVPVETDEGRFLYRFACSACGAMSALFSTVDLANDEGWRQGNSHAKSRCTERGKERA